MKIYITTYGRGAVQPTYHQLEAAGLQPTLVVDKRDHFDYSAFRHERGKYIDLRGKRHALQRRHWLTKEPFALIDDDLQICTVDPVRVATRFQVYTAFAMVDKLLDTCAQVGIHHRPFINYAQKPYTLNKGSFPFRVMAYNPALWLACPRPCPTYSGSDIWTWYELLRQHTQYAIVTRYCHSDTLHPIIPTHYTDAGKAKDFDELVTHMLGADRAKFTSVRRDGKRACTIQWSKLAKHYLGDTP
jgi:hypothetical protein